MQISHIKISNILGIEELEFSPNGFTKIAGRNGTGKTSVLEAIKAAIKGGHDATLLRNGADRGEVVLVLDDGTEVRKRVTASGSTTDVKKAGKPVPKPQAAIQALADMLSVNPVEFLVAPQKDRVRVLLESMPLEVDTARLSKIVGLEVSPRPGMHALHVIDQVRQQVFDARTGTNRAVKEKGGTINQLRQALPPEGSGPAGDEASLEGKLVEIDATRNAEGKRISDKLDALRRARDKANQNRRDTIDTLRAQIATIQEEIAGEDEAFNAWEGKANKQQQREAEKHLAASAPVKAALQLIRDDREAYARRQQTLETIGNLEVELEALELEASTQTGALEAIDAYKIELLNSLPIPGLEVKDGELFCGGVPFDRLNTAKQVDIAVEIAKVRAGELGVVCVDRIEALDSDTFDAFRQRAADADIQLFVTRVDDNDFSIESDN